ncbi:MAG: pilus assembly protein PilX [Halobacteria archaeon]|nr:pilus assembly protein PilX [Halobacteria archaeon]
MQTTRQHGAALVTSLIILLVLTVLGVSAMSTSSLEELMAGNLRDQTLSFQAAESALRDGERAIGGWPNGNAPAATSSGTNRGVYTLDTYGSFETTAYNTSVWNNGTTYGTDTGVAISNLGDVRTLPVYIIQEQEFVPKDASYQAWVKRQGKYFYRVTTRGTGASDNAVTLLQATTARRFK